MDHYLGIEPTCEAAHSGSNRPDIGKTSTYRTRQGPSPRVRRTARRDMHMRLPHRAEESFWPCQCVPLDAHSGTAGYTSSTGHGSNVRSMKRNAEPAAICRVRSNPVYSFAVGKSGARWKKMTSRPK